MNFTELEKYITLLETEIEKFNISQKHEELVQIITVIDSIFSIEIPNISREYEKFEYNSNLLLRSSKTILALLKSKQLELKNVLDLNKILYIEIDDDFTKYACDVLGETNKGLSTNDIYSWCNYYSNKFRQPIPISSKKDADAKSILNKRTILFENLKVFISINKFIIIKELLEQNKFENNDEAINLRKLLYTRYEHIIRNRYIINSQLINKTSYLLNPYKKSKETFDNAISKFSNKIYERNTLDDMRLSFELLLKDIFNNKKSLENQKENLGIYLKNGNISKETRNMAGTLISYYTLFQNNHVKHDSSYNEDEIEFIIELTSVIMNLLIKIKDS